MQGQRRPTGSFRGTIDFRLESSSSSTGMSQQSSMNTILNPVESSLSGCLESSVETACANATATDIQIFGRWNSGESSSRNLCNQVNEDGLKMEHDWSSSSSSSCSRAVQGPEERELEPTNILFPGRANIPCGRNQLRSEPLFFQGSSSAPFAQNVNSNAGHIGYDSNHWLGGEAGFNANINKPNGLQTMQASHGASCEHIGTSSRSSGYVAGEDNGEDNGSSGMENWGSSCKRKALEGSSRQTFPGGSSTSLIETETSAQLAGPALYNGSSNSTVSTPSCNVSIIGPPVQQVPRAGIGMSMAVADSFSSMDVLGNMNYPLRNFGRRINSEQLHESAPLNLSTGSSGRSHLSSFHQIPRPVSFGDSLDLRLTSGEATSSSSASTPQSQSHQMRVPGLSQNMQSFPWNGASNSRLVGTSSFLISGERTSREESNLRVNQQSSVHHPMSVRSTDMSNLVPEATNWHLASGNISTSTGVPSSWIGSSSSVHSLPNSNWVPHHETPTQNQQRLSEFSPWSPFPSYGLETGAHNNSHFSSLPSGPSTSSQETVLSSEPNIQVQHRPHRRSFFSTERRGDDVLNAPSLMRAFTTDLEGRRRLISEIRQVLVAMRRGETLHAEDFMLFDPFIHHGMAEIHDQHRDMRLDVDNMSYEELLALEERIGDVSTGLSEDSITKFLKQRKFISIMSDSPDMEPCCVCQEEYADGEDVGSLDCGHDFHTNCIRQWLMQKNLCPICKTTGLAT